jgi:hypothetical protein
MIAGRYDIIADQGSTLNRALVYLDSADVPVDLTGYDAALQVRENYGSTALVLSVSTAGTAPGIVLGGTAGTIDVSVSASVMADVPAGVYVYDLELDGGDDGVVKPVRGQFEVRPEVTR